MFRLLELRRKTGLSQTDVAQKLDVTQGAVSQWEKGETSPAAEKLPLLARLLGCSIDDLFQSEDV